MKKTEKYLSVMERRAIKAARKMEQNMDGECFEMHYHPLFALSAAPWCAMMLALAVISHTIISVLWLSVVCYAIGAVLLYFLIDWLSFRANIDGEQLTVRRLWIFQKKYLRTEITSVQLLAEKNSDSKKMILSFGEKKLSFVSEMIGFELLYTWINAKK